MSFTEMPILTSQGRTLDAARATLRRSAQMLAGKEVVREPFILPLPRRR